jgi:hypothetical protein
MDIRGQLNARLIFMAFFGGQTFENTRTPPDTLTTKTLIYPKSNRSFGPSLSVSYPKNFGKNRSIWQSLSLSLTIWIKFNFTVS